MDWFWLQEFRKAKERASHSTITHLKLLRVVWAPLKMLFSRLLLVVFKTGLGTLLNRCCWTWKWFLVGVLFYCSLQTLVTLQLQCSTPHLNDQICFHSIFIVQELCESRGGRPELSVLTSLLVSVDVKIYWTVLRHWSQLVPNMSDDIWGH